MAAMTILLADEDIERARSLSLRRGGGLRIGSYWCRTGPDSGCFGFRMFRRESSVCKGWNPVRVPPRAQCFRRSGAFLVFFRVDSVHTFASDLMFRVCGVPERPVRLCGGAAAYGGPGTALRGLFWVFILVRPSVGCSRSLLHGG